MSTHSRSVEVAAPPARVWAIWSDPAAWPTWNPNVTAMNMNQPFGQGATGTMTSGNGKQVHEVTFSSVQPGREFQLDTAVIPGSRFHFRCAVAPGASERTSTATQSISVSGPMGWLFGPMMGPQIAKTFEPLLAGLKKKAESEG